MTRTNTEIVRKIQAEFPSLQSEKKTLEGNHGLTLREAIRALYPTLRDMTKRGFSIREIAEKLDEYGVSIKPATLSKYMNETGQESPTKRNRVRRSRSADQTGNASATSITLAEFDESNTTSKAE